MSAHEKEFHASRSTSEAELLPYEKVLAHNIKDVVADLCLIDASIIIAYIIDNKHGNLNDLIDSATELFFKEGTLTYGHASNVNFEWGKAPAVILDMEFVHPSVTVFFKLVLHGFYVGVSIQKILLGTKSGQPDQDLNSFELALADSRLKPPPPSHT
ncbi:hypothetical protein [Microvirga puerhi]|uniref:Uncharacterized protein n=1 Tax=Microvirga puerhi TaxID=2876078 RepID=A0ABS7VUU5_9HYPH|nr:hypothetical protein [Microvirga puerhi]MBZ6079353.1 hypothetical protein [Microvirga puerhi]